MRDWQDSATENVRWQGKPVESPHFYLMGGIAFQNSTRTGESMSEKILEQTINIPPTIYKNQGDLASIYVARDLDFSTVYQLRAN